MAEIHKTPFGNFEEIQPEVYVSGSIAPSNLVVPASVSNTGTEQNLNIERNTVVFTDHESKQREQYLAEGANSGDLSNYFNTLSLFSSFANANQMNQVLSTGNADNSLQGLAVVEVDMSTENPGAFARRTNDTSGGLVQLSSESAGDYLSLFAGIKSVEDLNVPEAYIEAFPPYIAAHEFRHIEDKSLRGDSSRDVLAGEIEADHGSLRQYFNQDYNNFVMDMRALGSLNVIADEDDHATHIWTEEYGSGLMPTELEAENITSGPQKIYDRVVERTAEAFPEASRAEIDTALEDTGQRYAAFKALRERGAFNDIPNGNEFVDKYLAAAERRYNPEILNNAPVDELREAYLQRQGSAAVATNVPAQAPAPSISPG